MVGGGGRRRVCRRKLSFDASRAYRKLRVNISSACIALEKEARKLFFRKPNFIGNDLIRFVKIYARRAQKIIFVAPIILDANS